MERDTGDLDQYGPAVPHDASSADGVDLTLIRWMLSLTPEERLRFLQEHQTALAQIQATRERGPPWNSEPS